MHLNKVRLAGLTAMLGGALGTVMSPILAHLWDTYSDAYGAYGKLYFLSLPPELVAFYYLRKLRADGKGALERWGFRVSLVGMWLMVIGVFTDYWVLLDLGFLLQLVATPILMAGFLVLGVGLHRASTMPLGVVLVMVGAAVGAFPVTFLLVDHVPGGPLLTFHVAWVVLGYVIWSGKGVPAHRSTVAQ